MTNSNTISGETIICISLSLLTHQVMLRLAVGIILGLDASAKANSLAGVV